MPQISGYCQILHILIHLMNQIITTKKVTQTQEIQTHGTWQDFAGLSWIFLDEDPA